MTITNLCVLIRCWFGEGTVGDQIQHVESVKLCLTLAQGNESYLPVLRQHGILDSGDLGAIDVDRQSSLIEMQEIDSLDSYRMPGFWRKLCGDLS